MEYNTVIAVRRKIPTYISGEDVFVCDNANYRIELIFDEEWADNKTKTVLFILPDGSCVKTITENDSCEVPMMTKPGILYIGVKAGEKLKTTTPLGIPVRRSAQTMCGPEAAQIPPDIAQQIIERLDDLETDMENLKKEIEEEGGIKGEPGETPYIKDGYWWIGETNTNVKAQGETPYIKDGYWWIGETNTGVKAKGDDANVTTENIKKALGYTPANQTDVNQLHEQIAGYETELDDIKAQGLQQVPATPQGETLEKQLAWLSESGDTSKTYLLDDGYLYQYRTVTTTGGTEEVTEQIPGEFLEDKRLSTSNGGLRDLTGAITTPFVDITNYGNNFTIHLDGTSDVKWASLEKPTTDGCAYCFYNNGEMVRGGYTQTVEIPTTGAIAAVNGENDVDIVFDKSLATAEYNQVRFSAVTGRITNVSVSVTYTKTTTGGTAQMWVNTGRALTPTDYEDRIVKLESNSNSLNVRVKALEDGGRAENGVPSYVLTEAEEVADKILAVRNADSFVMALASDLHTKGDDTSAVGVRHAGIGMDTINSLTQIDLVALLGDDEVYRFSYGDADTDGEDARKSFKYVKNAFSSVAKGVPFMMLQGNHDELSTDTTEEARQKYYAYIGANNVGTVTDCGNKFRNYGYRDFDNHKIRVIYLNTADVSDGEVTADYNVSAEQLDWLNNVALNLDKSDWGIIVLSHHPLNWYGMTTLLNALDTYKGKGIGAELIAHFHGHLHNFRVETLGINSIPTITIPNACFGRNNEYGTSSSYSDSIHTMYGDTDVSGNQRQFNKTANSAEDTAFNMVVVDRQNRKIRCFNYGSGIDREISF